jgi:hypothetical protein
MQEKIPLSGCADLAAGIKRELMLARPRFTHFEKMLVVASQRGAIAAEVGKNLSGKNPGYAFSSIPFCKARLRMRLFLSARVESQPVRAGCDGCWEESLTL